MQDHLKAKREELVRHLADAYRECEADICDLKSATIVLDALQEHVIGKPHERGADTVVFHLTEDQWDGLIYAIRHVGHLARGLEKSYCAAYAAFIAPAEEKQVAA